MSHMHSVFRRNVNHDGDQVNVEREKSLHLNALLNKAPFKLVNNCGKFSNLNACFAFLSEALAIGLCSHTDVAM